MVQEVKLSFHFCFGKSQEEDQEEYLNNVVFLWAHLFSKIHGNPLDLVGKI